MPRGDGTGPAGMGPKTGRAAGYCAGFPAPGFMNTAPGFGRGRGFGRGFGWRRFYPAQQAWYPVPAQAPQAVPQFTKEEEIRELKAEKAAMAEELKSIDARLKELEKQK